MKHTGVWTCKQHGAIQPGQSFLHKGTWRCGRPLGLGGVCFEVLLEASSGEAQRGETERYVEVDDGHGNKGWKPMGETWAESLLKAQAGEGARRKEGKEALARIAELEASGAPAIRKQERERVFNRLHSRDVVTALCQTREAEAGMPEAIRAVLEVAQDDLENSDA